MCKSLHGVPTLERCYISYIHNIVGRYVQLTRPAGARKAVYVILTNPLLSDLFMNVLTEFG